MIIFERSAEWQNKHCLYLFGYHTMENMKQFVMLEYEHLWDHLTCIHEILVERHKIKTIPSLT